MYLQQWYHLHDPSEVGALLHSWTFILTLSDILEVLNLPHQVKDGGRANLVAETCTLYNLIYALGFCKHDTAWHVTPGPEPLHCEKSLFVLASRQKIPVLRTENPAVNTRTICLLPIEFFLNSPCQKSYGQKLQVRPEIPAFCSLEGDFLHSHAGKS